MSFDNPQGLWLLALGVPVLVFHFYKGRIRKLAVPTLLFWEQVIVEEERRTALHKLRHWASLFLCLAALVLLTSAVAGPEVKGLTREKRRYALILDGSPSMAVVEEGGRTRGARAVERAREFARSLGHGDQVSVQDASGSRAPFTTDLEGAARKIVPPPVSLRADVREAVAAARAAGDDVVAVLFTDRTPEGVGDLLEAGALRVATVGTPRPNVGWTSGLSVRRAGEKRVTLSLVLSSFSEAEEEREAVLAFNGKTLRREAVRLKPGERLERAWVLDPSAFPGEKIEEGGLAGVALEPSDALAADDTASFVVPPLAPPKVLVLHPGKPDALLMVALTSLRTGGVVQEVLLASPDAYPRVREQLGEGWIVVFDRVAPPASLGSGGYLILGAPGARTVERPTIADWDREAPPNRWLDYGGVLLRRSRILDGTPLIRAVEGPVAVWSARGGRAVVELGFALEDGDLRPSLPILLFNFVEWAAFPGLRSYRTEYRVGEPIRPERPLWIDEGELFFEAADRAERLAVRRGRPERTPAAGAGFVRVRGGGRAEWAAVNLFEPGVSDLRAREPATPSLPLPPPAPWHARIPYAAVAGAAVAALLLLEWWLFMRGLV
jgi:hypothetical protein